MASLISRLTGRQESRQKARQKDRHMYRKTEYRKIKYRKTDVQTYMYIFVQTYIYRHRDTQTYGRADKQADRQTGTVHTVEADSRTASKQAVRHTGLQTERQTYRKNDS